MNGRVWLTKPVEVFATSDNAMTAKPRQYRPVAGFFIAMPPSHNVASNRNAFALCSFVSLAMSVSDSSGAGA